MALNLHNSAELSRLFPLNPETSCVTVICPRTEYAASRIARAVEDCDAHLLNLNITADTRSADEVVVELRVSHRNPHAVVRSLERYGYTAVTDMPETTEAEALLQRYLDI